MSEDKLWVLIVDDEEAIREGLAEWLARSEGMTVDTVASGEEALTLIQEAEGAYDAVLLDEVLPGIQGIETLERIKAKFPNIQVIMFTGKSPDSGIEALRKGAYRYLMKPPNNEELAYLLRHIGEIREMERELAQERLRRQREEKLRAFPAPVSLAFEFDQVAQKILNDLQEVVEYRKASLQLVRDDMRMLLAGAGFDEHKIDRWLLRPVSQDPLITRVVRGQEPLILSHTAQDPDWQQSAATFNVNSWVGLPLVHNQEVVGLITMDHDRPGFYTEKIKEKLLAFARQMALDVLRMRFFDNAQRRIRDLEILNSVEQIIGTKLDTDSLLETIAEQIVEHLDCTHCTLFFQAEEDHQIVLVPRVTKGGRAEKIRRRRFKPGEGLAGWVFETGQSYVSPDVHGDTHFAQATDPIDQPRSMLVVPIQVGDRTIGVISADQDAYGWFSESDQRLVEALGRQAGIAIERAEGLRLVRAIGNEIISAQKVDEILRRIVLGAIQLTHTITGVIYLLSEDKKSIAQSFVHPQGFDRPLPRMGGKGGLTRKIIQTGELEEIFDIQKDEGTNPKLLELGFRSMIGIPLKLEVSVIGVLYLNDNKPRHFTEAEQVLLATLAGQAATAIQKAKRFEQLVMLHETSQSLLALESQQSTRDVLRKIALNALSALGADLVDIYEYQQGQKEFVNLPQVTAGKRRGKFVGTVHPTDAIFDLINEKRPEYIEQARSYPAFISEHEIKFEDQPETRFVFREEIQSCAVVPLRIGNEPVGLLFVNYRTEQRFTTEERNIIEMFANYAAIAINNARSIEKIWMQRESEVQAIQEISQSISASPESRQKVLENILDGALPLMKKASFGEIRLLDKLTNELVVEVFRGEGINEAYHRIPIGKGITGWVAEHREPLLIPDVTKDRRYLPFLSGTRSEMAIPMIKDDTVIGVMNIEHPQVDAFDNNHLRLAEAIADLSVVAITNAQILQELRQHSTQLVKLQEVAATISSEPSDLDKVLHLIVDNLSNIFSAAACDLRLYDAHTSKFGTWVPSVALESDFDHPPRPKGSSHYVIANRKPRYIEDTTLPVSDGGPAPHKGVVEEGIRAIAYLPLLGKDEPLGILYVGLSEPYHFSKDERRLLDLFARQASIAIENAHLFQDLRELSDQLIRLQEVSTTISSETTDLDKVLHLITDNLTEMFGGISCAVRLFDSRKDEFWKRVGIGTLEKGYPPRPNGTSRWVITNKKPLYIENTEMGEEEKPQVRSELLEKNVKAIAYLPLISGEDVIGVLYTNWNKIQFFSGSQKRILTLFADKAATAINTALLIQRLEKALKQSEERRVENAQLVQQLEQALKQLEERRVEQLEAFSSIGETLADLELES